MPKRLQALPRDKRGYPITFTVYETSAGVFDFTTTDPAKWMLAVQRRLCGMCGKGLGNRKIWFIGGPLSIHNRVFYDHPMHEDCARYAMVTCPYISMPKYMGAKSRPTPEDIRVPIVSSNSTKPDRFGLASCVDYEMIVFQGDSLLMATPWIDLEWWKDGERLSEISSGKG